MDEVQREILQKFIFRKILHQCENLRIAPPSKTLPKKTPPRKTPPRIRSTVVIGVNIRPNCPLLSEATGRNRAQNGSTVKTVKAMEDLTEEETGTRAQNGSTAKTVKAVEDLTEEETGTRAQNGSTVKSVKAVEDLKKSLKHYL